MKALCSFETPGSTNPATQCHTSEDLISQKLTYCSFQIVIFNFLLLFSELPTIILQNQVPKGMKKSEALMQMEATIKKYTSEIFLTEDDLYDVEKKQPPR
jgi:hypothetical protein